MANITAPSFTVPAGLATVAVSFTASALPLNALVIFVALVEVAARIRVQDMRAVAAGCEGDAIVGGAEGVSASRRARPAAPGWWWPLHFETVFAVAAMPVAIDACCALNATVPVFTSHAGLVTVAVKVSAWAAELYVVAAFARQRCWLVTLTPFPRLRCRRPMDCFGCCTQLQSSPRNARCLKIASHPVAHR